MTIVLKLQYKKKKTQIQSRQKIYETIELFNDIIFKCNTRTSKTVLFRHATHHSSTLENS